MNTQNTQQNLQNIEELDRLQVENAELKKKLEREETLHSMLYKEWKELSENAFVYKQAVTDNRPKNLFYKYAFFVLLIAIFPIYYLLNFINSNDKKVSPAPITTIVRGDSALPEDSSPGSNDEITNTVAKKAERANKPETVKSKLPGEPVLNAEENKTDEGKTDENKTPGPDVAQAKKTIRPDTAEASMVASSKAVVEQPLTDSVRDVVYWEGWNAFYNNSKNHFRRSSARYKIWVEGYNDARSDAKELVSKDSL